MSFTETQKYYETIKKKSNKMFSALRCKNVASAVSRQFKAALLRPQQKQEKNTKSLSQFCDRSFWCPSLPLLNRSDQQTKRWKSYKAAILEEFGHPLVIRNVENNTSLGGEMVSRGPFIHVSYQTHNFFDRFVLRSNIVV